MKIFGVNIITDRDLTRMVQDGAASLAERRATSIVKRWAGNETCLAAMFAARHRQRPENAFVTPSVLEMEARSVVAFLDAVGRERGE